MSGGKRGVVGEFVLDVREVECGRIGSGVVRLGWVGLVGREERGCWNCVEME